MVYAGVSRPHLVEGFTKKTFTAMVEGIRQAAIDAGIIGPADIERGIKDLYRTSGDDGVFSYSFSRP